MDWAKLMSALRGNPPATAEEVSQAEQALGFALPPDYAEFLQFTNGGAGVVGESHVVLYTLAEICAIHSSGLDFGRSGRFLAFASEGSNTEYAFDLSNPPSPPVFKVDKIDDNFAHPLAAGFREFIEHLARQKFPATGIHLTEAEKAGLLKRSGTDRPRETGGS